MHVGLNQDDEKQPKPIDEGQQALEKEVKMFNKRESYFVAFKVRASRSDFVKSKQHILAS